MSYVEVREPGSEKLLFRFDPARDIIEVQRRGVKTLVNLREIKENACVRRREERAGQQPEVVL